MISSSIHILLFFILTFRALKHLEYTFLYMVWGIDRILPFSKWLFSCLNSFYTKTYLCTWFKILLFRLDFYMYWFIMELYSVLVASVLSGQMLCLLVHRFCTSVGYLSRSGITGAWSMRCSGLVDTSVFQSVVPFYTPLVIFESSSYSTSIQIFYFVSL